MHPTIRRFKMEGEVSDDRLVYHRDLLDQIMLESMRENGYVPVLGLGPMFSTEYDREKDVLVYEVSYYGVRVGKKKSWNIEGMDLAGRLLRRTPPTKSEESSAASEW